MADTPNSIRTLRKFTRTKRVLSVEEMMTELMGQSHRGTVILVAALLEDALTEQLGSIMRDYDGIERLEKLGPLFGPNRHLSSFSAKIDLAYFLMRIDDGMRSQLHDIREMRNACAHSQQPISFADEELVGVFKRIIAPVGVCRWDVIQDSTPDHFRELFVAEAMILDRAIRLGSSTRARIELHRLLHERPQS
jgi:DNA-binding MltR family transcriptional regulator